MCTYFLSFYKCIYFSLAIYLSIHPFIMIYEYLFSQPIGQIIFEAFFDGLYYLYKEIKFKRIMAFFLQALKFLESM